MEHLDRQTWLYEKRKTNRTVISIQGVVCDVASCTQQELQLDLISYTVAPNDEGEATKITGFLVQKFAHLPMKENEDWRSAELVLVKHF